MEALSIPVFVLSVVTGVGALTLSIISYLGNRANQKAVQVVEVDRLQLDTSKFTLDGLRDLAEAQSETIKNQADTIKYLQTQLNERRSHAEP